MLSAFLLLPLWYQYLFIGGMGLIIGSFLNVFLYRLHTGKSLAGSSHCLSCGKGLRWYELLPLFSYLALRGRCSECGSFIPVRYFVVEFTTALLFLWSFELYGVSLVALTVAFLLVVLLCITIYDYYHMIIPNELVVAAGAGALLFFLAQYWGMLSLDILLWHVIAGLGAASFYGALWLISRGQWIGLGDAKLAIPLGFVLGPVGAFSFVVLSFWVGAAMSVCLLLLPLIRGYVRFVGHFIRSIFSTCPQPSVVNYRRYFTMKSEVPFAPFMVIAFLLAFLLEVDVLALMGLFL